MMLIELISSSKSFLSWLRCSLSILVSSLPVNNISFILNSLISDFNSLLFLILNRLIVIKGIISFVISSLYFLFQYSEQLIK